MVELIEADCTGGSTMIRIFSILVAKKGQQQKKKALSWILPCVSLSIWLSNVKCVPGDVSQLYRLNILNRWKLRQEIPTFA